MRSDEVGPRGKVDQEVEIRLVALFVFKILNFYEIRVSGRLYVRQLSGVRSVYTRVLGLGFYTLSTLKEVSSRNLVFVISLLIHYRY